MSEYIDPPPISGAAGQIALSDALIAHMANEAGKLARKERLLMRPLNIEQFAERVIRATLGAINANREDPRMRDWLFEKAAIACLDDEQAEQSFARWKGYSYAN